MPMCGDGVGLEGPWEASAVRTWAYSRSCTIVHATVMVTSTTFDSDILEGQTLYVG